MPKASSAQVPSNAVSLGGSSRGNTAFDPRDGFGADYRAFFDLDLGQTFEWLEHDGVRLAVQRFAPPGEACGDVVLVHGYYDHVGLYGHAIRYLLGRGFRVHCYDQEGHGLSSGERATIASFDRYASALAAFIETIPSCAGARWIVGQSMGGSVILEHLDRNPETDFDQVLLLAPLVRPWQWPLNRLVWLAARPFLGSIPRAFAANTDNPEFMALLRADPLQAKTLPVAWVTAMARWLRQFEARGASERKLTVIQGGEDRTVDATYNLVLLERRYRIEVFELPTARHHLVNESEAIRAEIWRYLDGR
ncbi:MAG: alpha/beta hydrolase [Gammaproteobacteria bacterium]|nr:alpha/beta hydrolase [Gammaproteobacteria bacterium]